VGSEVLGSEVQGFGFRGSGLTSIMNLWTHTQKLKPRTLNFEPVNPYDRKITLNPEPWNDFLKK
jgi:hypothetical protein